MSNFDNLTPPTSAFIDENNDIQDIQSVLEGGTVVVTAVAAAPAVPIGTATTPKFENISPWAGKFVNPSDEIIGLMDFLTSGAISVNVVGGGGGQSSERYFDGCILEPADVNVSSDGSIFSLSIQKSGGGDLTLLFSTGQYVFDCTPPANITFGGGSNASPATWFFYIPISTKVLTASFSSFPFEEHIPISKLLAQSASSAQSDGVYKNQNFLSGIYSDNGNGHSTHINSWIRSQPATWVSGVLLSTVVGFGVFNIQTNSGVILQLHENSFPSFNTGTGSHIYVPNESNPGDKYHRATDLTTLTTDASGGSMIGTRFNLVIWGSVSYESGDCQIFINLPTDTYDQDNLAIQDSNSTAVYDISTDFTGTGFLISRLTVREDSGTWSILNNQDLRADSERSTVDLSAIFSEEIRRYFDGMFVETPDISFSSDGVTITISLEKLGGGDLTILYSTGEFILDSTPPVTISLIAGTDDSPIENYIYIPISTKVLTVSTSGFPSAEEYCAVSEAFCQTAASVQVDGLYKTHEWTSHMSDAVGNGHSQHLDFWIRRQNATWLSGVSLTPTLGALQFSIATSVGEVLQLHKHAFAEFDTSAGSHVYVQNSFSVPYQRVTDLTSILTDANGASMAGKNFNLVVWGSVNGGNIDQLYINVPSATYNNDSSAINDISGTTIYDIGNDFKGTGFLIARLTVKHQTTGGGVWSLLNNEDLRGKIPSNAAGGGTGGIDAVVEDTTPQLGGDLDVNGFVIKGVSATVDFFSSIGVNIDAPQTSVVSLAYIDLITNRIDFSPVDQSFRIDSIQRMRITSAGLQLQTGATVNNIDNTGASVLATDLVTAFGMQTAIADAIDSGVSFRGAWDASVNLYPSAGGSGAAGAIEKGNWWYISVGGTLGANPVEPGDQIFATSDTPGQSDSNWLVVIQKVDSVFGRVGAVLPVSGDYSFPQVTGLPATATSGYVMQGSGTAWQEATIAQGTGMSIANVSGTITFTNASPDQTVALTNGTSISVTGTYPNFTINNTDPDQTVVLNSGVGISVTGTYPNFTIANTATLGSFVSVTTATQALSVNTTYYTTFAGLSVMTLPVTATAGTTIRVMAGPSGNTFKIAQNANQQIFYGALLGLSVETTVGVVGYLESTEPNTSVLLMCVVTDTQWKVVSNVNQLNVEVL